MIAWCPRKAKRFYNYRTTVIEELRTTRLGDVYCSCTCTHALSVTTRRRNFDSTVASATRDTGGEAFFETVARQSYRLTLSPGVRGAQESLLNPIKVIIQNHISPSTRPTGSGAEFGSRTTAAAAGRTRAYPITVRTSRPSRPAARRAYRDV